MTDSKVFGLPPGVNFAGAFADGLKQRLRGAPPHELARTQVFVNNTRMQADMMAAFQMLGGFCPVIRTLSDIGFDLNPLELPETVSPLRRRLELSQLIRRLIAREPGLSPQSAVFDLADNLAALMVEMHDEGITPDALDQLDIEDASGHWQRSVRFLRVISPYFGPTSAETRSRDALMGFLVDLRIQAWRRSPPKHRVIIAGTTGSRGPAARLMAAAAELSTGAVVLPGFDFEMDARAWARFDVARPNHDHPQFRFARLAHGLGIDPLTIPLWHDPCQAPNSRRNALISLALRPAPFTDDWLTEGPKFADIDKAMTAVDVIEAPNPRAEALAIALVLREAVDRNQSAALITPDRGLARQVSAALDRWRITPDDSAGIPLGQTAPGRLIRHTAEALRTQMSGENLLILLKHPLVAATENWRHEHSTITRAFELWMRRSGPAFPKAADIHKFIAVQAQSSGRQDAPERAKRLDAWAHWISGLLAELVPQNAAELAQHLNAHRALLESLAAGPDGGQNPELWNAAAGREAARVMADLAREADHGGTLTIDDYVALVTTLMNGAEVRDSIAPHPLVKIRGTRDARAQSADVVILGGLVDGVWPASPPPDTWFSRHMRHQLGLLSPEQRIGLAAHDFQQAAGAGRVVLSRAIRDSETETVPSRWLNRLTNLLDGMGRNASECLAAARVRGQRYIAMAALLEAPEGPPVPAPRPCPAPPVHARPKSLSVTAIERLISDPYSIYATRVLKLNKLGELRKIPDASLRGTLIHDVLERFIKSEDFADLPRARAHLMGLVSQALDEAAPWPTIRILWHNRFEHMVDWFLETEIERRKMAVPVPSAMEKQHGMALAGLGAGLDFRLTVKPDRIDRDGAGNAYVYDYKSGKPPSQAEVDAGKVQLLLASVMVEAGVFDALGPAPVKVARYIGLGSPPAEVDIKTGPDVMATVTENLTALISAYFDPKTGYLAYRKPPHKDFAGDFEQLSRYGEWSLANDAPAQKVGE